MAAVLAVLAFVSYSGMFGRPSVVVTCVFTLFMGYVIARGMRDG